jgi:hypothetical protein
MCKELHHCVPLIKMVKKHIWNVQFEVRMRELCLQKMYELPVLPVLDHWYYRSEKVWRRYELPVLPVFDWYYQWLAEEGVVLRENELPVLPVLDQYYRWSLTRSTGRCLFRI